MWVLIKNGIVDNIIVANQQFVDLISSDYEACIEIPVGKEPPHIGTQYKDGKFVDSALETLQKERNNNLALLRELRDAKLKEVDIMVTEITLGIRSDVEAVREYRHKLLNFINPLRDETGQATEAIDSVKLYRIEWPNKPA